MRAKDPRLEPHNLQWQGHAAFVERDPTLRRARRQPLFHEPALLGRLPLATPGIYTLVGGRQVGKSTLLKLAMQRLLEREGVEGDQLAYVACEPYADADDLRTALTDLLAAMAAERRATWLFLDEITYVDGWDRAIKFLADAGVFDRCAVLLTGSDHVLIQDSLKRLPGRRGQAEQVDFHLRPLTFLEFCRLRGTLPAADLAALGQVALEDELTAVEDATLRTVDAELRAFHQTGGYLVAINDVAAGGDVLPATLRIYSDWIRGDVLRLNRNERYLREVLGAIDRRYGSQITWTALARDLSIDHPKTVADYVAILERMDAALVVPALDERTRGPAPKKARKVFFADPFIHRAVRAWLGRSDDGDGDELVARELEATFAAHAGRAGAAFYVKAKGEIDLAWYEGRELRLMEVKWTGQLRPEELKEIRRRGTGVVAARVRRAGRLDGVAVLPAAVCLLRLAARAEGSARG